MNTVSKNKIYFKLLILIFILLLFRILPLEGANKMGPIEKEFSKYSNNINPIKLNKEDISKLFDIVKKVFKDDDGSTKPEISTIYGNTSAKAESIEEDG